MNDKVKDDKFRIFLLEMGLIVNSTILAQYLCSIILAQYIYSVYLGNHEIPERHIVIRKVLSSQVSTVPGSRRQNLLLLEYRTETFP